MSGEARPGVAEPIDKLLIDLPMPIRTPRLVIRPWWAGDGQQLLQASAWSRNVASLLRGRPTTSTC